MSKILALDVGDVWTGTALSDALALLARPYKTVKTVQLETFLKDLLDSEPIDSVVVGNPRTLRGTVSQQTVKAQQVKERLERKFDMVSWVLWDERLTSKRAQALKRSTTKDERIDSHSIAAAFILDSYLEYRRFHRPE